MRATTAPPFSMLESLTFRIGRFLAHYGEAGWDFDQSPAYEDLEPP